MENWYAFRVFKSENKTMDTLNKLIRAKEINGLLEVKIPLEKKYQRRASKTIVVERNSLPGYLLLRLDSRFLEEIKIALKPYVGANILASPLKDEEIKRFFEIENEELATEPELDMEVTITEGPFASWKGKVIEVLKDKKKVKVEVKVFGRITPVEVNFKQIEL